MILGVIGGILIVAVFHTEWWVGALFAVCWTVLAAVMSKEDR